ncbi:hypothetical protein J6I39_09235 [bacterium]|nr:hypothetical protein [bacterium]
MKISSNNQTVFRAKYKNPYKIAKFKDGYGDFTASFVEIEPHNEKDVSALENAIKYWEHDKFGQNALYATRAARDGSQYYKYHKVYALTAQEDNFEKLNPDEILGVVHVGSVGDKKLFVEHLQTNPNYLYKSTPKYVGIGSAMINSLKKYCNMMSLFSSKEKSVKDFYLKNGFVEYGPGTNCYVWVKDIFERF